MDEEARMEGLQGLGILGTPREARFDRIVRLAARLAGGPMAALSFIDKDREWFKSGHGWSAVELPRRHSLGAHAILGTGPFVVEDLRCDPRFKDHPLAGGAAGLRFYAAVPMRGPRGGHVGVLAVMGPQARSVSPDDLQALQELGLLAEDELAARGRPGPAAEEGRLLHAMPWPAATVDQEGRLLALNDAWRRFAARDGPIGAAQAAGEDLLHRLARRTGGQAEGSRRLAEGLEAVLAGRREGFHMDAWRAEEGGQHFRIHVRCLRLDSGPGALLMQEDRTDAVQRLRLEEAMLEKGLELEEMRSLERTRRHVLDAMAKDLSTPITPIRLQLHLLRSGRIGPLTDQQSRSLESIVRNTLRWSELSRTLLALLAHPPRSAPLEEIDALVLARQAVAGHKTQALQAGIGLEGPRGHGALPVRCAPEAVRQVLAQLFDAALGASCSGDRLELEARRDGDTVLLAMHQGGGGMEPAEAARLFDEDPRRVLEAKRLALLRCRRIMADLGGSIEAESDGVGRGMEYRVRLPAATGSGLGGP